MNANKKYFVIDVESIGLHGEAYAVAGGLYYEGGCDWEFCFAVDPEFCRGSEIDRRWCRENIPQIPKTHGHRYQMRNAFWEKWLEAKRVGALMAAECLWPVEAGFLSKVIKDRPDSRTWEGPYPFIEISSVMMAAGMDPMAEYPRLDGEGPKHNPLADARQSARLLLVAEARLNELLGKRWTIRL